MKKQFALFVTVLTLVLSTFGFANRTFFTTVKATYVEGPITQDTYWTLVNSPYIISNDVTVYPNSTLTIEPAVEVRFGGNFSLRIEGKLVANGTEDRNIKFTSNKLEPIPGDWITIRFDGTMSSSFVYCIVEYAKDGITHENGGLSVQNSIVRFNSESGISMANGDLTVLDNSFLNNTGSGISIEGCNYANVKNNDFTDNSDGITLTGYLTSQIDIEQNNFSLNRHGGMFLLATGYDNTVIINNRFSENSDGFYVATTATTNITRNYIWNNTVGVFYEAGTSHQAHYNDITDNEFGMSVSGSAVVDATYNYWGDRSGPYHESLNPRGNGNPVGGDGLNLDFIFFLSAPIDYTNQRPTANLWADKSLVARNQNVTFIGADSYDDGRVDQYFFDFGDGKASGWTTLSIFNHTYSTTGVYIASLTVVDDFNVTSVNVATATINVQNLLPLKVAVTLSNETINYSENVSVTVYVSDGTTPIENASVSLFSVKGGNFTPMTGMTDATGHFAATFTAPNVVEITDIRILARAAKSGRADGSDFRYLRVFPPLKAEVIAEPEIIKSEETATVYVIVTIGSEEPVPNALLVLSCDHGSLSPLTATTDIAGNATFEFTAPQALTQIITIITATAMKIEYAQGQGQTSIVVQPKVVDVTLNVEPAAVFSEARSTITAHVAYDAIPIFGAAAVISSDSGGSFSNTTGTTDLSGNVIFVFTAPRVTVQDPISAGITVTASMSGYVNGEKQTIVTVYPKLLAVQIDAQPNSTVSEARVNVTVHVAYAYDMSPISEADITIKCEDGGNFSTTTGLTDSDGDVGFAFTAPQVNTPLGITITASATKTGYVDGQNSSIITVSPGILSVRVQTESQSLMSAESTVVRVSVACNETPVYNASVTMSANYGNFTIVSSLTNLTGQCIFVFNAPSTAIQLPVTIVANVTRNGYVSAGNQTTLNVVPQVAVETGGGWPLITILLIIVPIVIVVVVVVLIKLKVIAVTLKEET